MAAQAPASPDAGVDTLSGAELADALTNVTTAAGVGWQERKDAALAPLIPARRVSGGQGRPPVRAIR